MGMQLTGPSIETYQEVTSYSVVAWQLMRYVRRGIVPYRRQDHTTKLSLTPTYCLKM